MKHVLSVCYVAAVLIVPCLATTNEEIQAVLAVHEAWELAFEGADINAIESVWAHDGDVLIVTPLGTRHQGFAEVKGALKNLFALFGQTTIDVLDSFLTIKGDEASMTMTDKWSPARERVFPLTERYRKVNGEWKIYISDSQGHTLPLRPDDEKAIKQLAKQVQGGLLDKDIPAIAEWVADDFTYVATDGTIYHGWQTSANVLAADVEVIADLQFQSIALIENQACALYSLTLASGNRSNLQLTFSGPNWKLTQINLKPEAKSRVVVPNGTTVTQWAQIKMNRR